MVRSITALAVPLLFVTFAAAAADTSLEEVVVTAELRDRELRNLPASATVLDAQTIKIAGVQHFEDVIGLVPNLNWSAGTSRPRFFQIRGIGELEQWQGAPNPSVGFLIDGIDFSGVGMPATLADVERIEVLRGPQGTVYGANALAGLIAINTRAPNREPEFDGDITFGDYATKGLTGVVGGPLGDDTAAWRAVVSRYESDGFRHNAYVDRDDTNGYDESTVRLRIHVEPLQDLSADVTAMWVDLDNGYDAFALDNSRTTHSDKPGQDAQLARALAAKLRYTGESFDVVSLSTYGDSRSIYSFDGDWGNDRDWGVYAPYDYFERFDRDRQTISQDLRIVSHASVDDGAAFSWLGGLYALRTDEDVRQNDVFHDQALGDGDDTLTSAYRATNLAAYGELEWRVAAATVVSVGARGERRDAHYEDSDSAQFAPAETLFGGSLSVRHAFDESRGAYLTFARGYKAGGFNIGAQVPADHRRFDAELLHSVELGFRASAPVRAISGDAALFYMRRRSQQVATGEQLDPRDPLSFVLYTDNAARGENYGVEGTLRWRPLDALLLDLSGAILKSRYLGYRFGERNLDGREQAHAPEYQYDLGVEYRNARGVFGRIDFAGLDDFYFDASNDERAPARVLTHLKAGYSGKHWRAEVWVRNLFDRYYSQRGFRFSQEPPDFTPTRYVQAGDPRHVGVTVAYSFR